jgi:hypothetical protein
MWTWGSFEPKREQAVLAILGFVACSPLDLSSITVSLAIQLPRKATRPAGCCFYRFFSPLRTDFHLMFLAQPPDDQDWLCARDAPAFRLML